MGENEEVKEIKKKVILCSFVFIFVVIMGLLLVFNRFGGSDVDAVTSALRNNENFVVFFGDEDKNFEYCSTVKNRLNSLGVSYYDFNVRAPSFDSVLQKLNINYELKIPAIYVIEKGEVIYNITDIQDIDIVDSFVKENQIVNYAN